MTSYRELKGTSPDTETHSKEHGTRHRDSKEHVTRHRDPLKGTWNQTQRPGQRNMGRDIQTVTSYRDLLKGIWDQTQRPTQRNMDQTQRPTQRNMDQTQRLKGTWDETSRQ